MVKITFDTNVLLSALLSEKGASYYLVRLATEHKVTGYTSKTLMEEFKEIVQRDYEFPIEKAEQLIGNYVQFLSLVEPDFRLKVVKEDPDDDRVVECAVYSGSNYIVSWDPHLTNLIEINGVKIQNPGKLLETLKEKHGIE